MSDTLIPIMDEETEEKKSIAQEAGLIVQDATALSIQNDEQFHSASSMLREIKRVQKEVDEYFDPAIKKAYETHKAILDAKKKQSEPLKKAERIIKSKVNEYHAEQERIRWEEERKRQEELRKQEEERRLKEAVDTGDETILDEPIVVPTVKLEDTTKHEGISYSEIWKFKVVDISKVPAEYKVVDEKKVNQVVRAMKGNTNIPGIEVYAEKVVRAAR